MPSPEVSQSIPPKARLEMFGRFFQEAVFHPLSYSHTFYDHESGSVKVERYKGIPEGQKPVSPSLRLKLVGALFKEALFHPLGKSTYTVDIEANRIIVDREIKPKKA